MVKFEISAITDEFSQEFDEVCEHLHSIGVKYVELRKVWVGNIIEIDDQTINDAMDILDDNHLKVSALSTPLLKCLPPSINPNPRKATDYTENWRYNFSKIDRALELAKKMNAKYIRVFGFQGKWDIKPLDQWDNWQIYKEWSDILEDMKKKVSSANKTLILENESGIASSFTQLEKIAKDHSDDNFGLLFDTANAPNHYGHEGVLTSEWLDRLSPYIKYFHAKGCVELNGKFHTALVNEKGDVVNWPRILEYFSNLEKDDFVGNMPDPLFISIETHMGNKNSWENSTKSLQNLQKLIENFQ